MYSCISTRISGHAYISNRTWRKSRDIPCGYTSLWSDSSQSPWVQLKSRNSRQKYDTCIRARRFAEASAKGIFLARGIWNSRRKLLRKKKKDIYFILIILEHSTIWKDQRFGNSKDGAPGTGRDTGWEGCAIWCMRRSGFPVSDGRRDGGTRAPILD